MVYTNIFPNNISLFVVMFYTVFRHLLACLQWKRRCCFLLVNETHVKVVFKILKFYFRRSEQLIFELAERSCRFFSMLFRARSDLAQKPKFQSQCFICTFSGWMLSGWLVQAAVQVDWSSHINLGRGASDVRRGLSCVRVLLPPPVCLFLFCFYSLG